MNSKDPERNKTVYVTWDRSSWMKIDIPFGLIPPPTLELHQPMAGPVVFYNSEMYELSVPNEANE